MTAEWIGLASQKTTTAHSFRPVYTPAHSIRARTKKARAALMHYPGLCVPIDGDEWSFRSSSSGAVVSSLATAPSGKSSIRLPEDTNIADASGEWVEVRHLRQRAGRLRVFTNVRIWKGSTRRATVCLYRLRAADGTMTTWYLVTNVAGDHTRFIDYAGRWWQECTHTLVKRALFNGRFG